MRRALMVGINHYTWAPLRGCINDAQAMKEILEKNYDDSPNFYCNLLISSDTKVSKDRLKKEIGNLLQREGEVALFYFSGHGQENDLGGCLVTQDATKYDEGFPISQLITMVNQAEHIREIVIILDCCHAGYMGNLPNFSGNTALLRKGVSIMTASMHNEYAMEKGGYGIFTSMIREGLKGGAADLTGEVTSASLYNYTDKLLTPWQQRPVYKAHVTSLTSLRACEPEITLTHLRKITEFFPEKDYVHALSPEYIPSLNLGNQEKQAIFKVLQKYRAVNLIVPIDKEHMYYAAKHNKGCALTALGKFYWSMVKSQRI